MKLHHPVFFLTIVLLFLSACKKENEEIDYNANLEAAKNDVVAERAFAEVFNMLFKAGNDTSIINNGGGILDSAEIRYDSLPEVSIRVKYPPWYHPCPDNRIRKGYYTANLTGKLNEPGTIATVEFYNYHVQYKKVEGQMTITNQGYNQSNQLNFRYVVTNGTLSFIDSLSVVPFSWDCSKTAAWVSGSNSPHDFSDDVFQINGESSGISVNGDAFFTEVTTPLTNAFGCWYLVSGILDISTPDLEVTYGTTDYVTDDGCSNMVHFYFDDLFFYHRYH